MALCRVAVYALAALAVTSAPPTPVYAGAGSLFLYLVFLRPWRARRRCTRRCRR